MTKNYIAKRAPQESLVMIQSNPIVPYGIRRFSSFRKNNEYFVGQLEIYWF